MTEPRSDTEIREDIERLRWVTTKPTIDMIKTRLVADVAPLLDALSAALAAKEAAEQRFANQMDAATELLAENEQLRKQLDEAARYGLDSGL